jgi:hypothetical protein
MSFDPSVSHTVSGQSRPQVNEIFAPDHHAGALDPNVPIVLGSRGSGKSFWAGVLGNTETRNAAAALYPRLGLNRVETTFGFIGLGGEGAVSRETIDSILPEGSEKQKANLLWRAVVLRAVMEVHNPTKGPRPKIRKIMDDFKDPEDWEEQCEKIDHELWQKKKTALVIFDAIDALAEDYYRLEKLLDSLLQVTWSIKSYKSIRMKLFLRDDQVSQLRLKFVELPKLISGATRLYWRGSDLYGMFFERLATQKSGIAPLNHLLDESNLPLVPRQLKHGKGWLLSYDQAAQAKLFTRFAGQFMGRTHKKGRTYDWPLNHLSDGHNQVTPRSFLALMINAAKHLPPPENTVLSAEGIRHGLREASKIRVEQLDREFPWIRRVLAPLARLQVPCDRSQILERWEETETFQAVRKLYDKQRFLLPFSSNDQDESGDELLESLKAIGVMTTRDDGRYDMPDLFRVAARLLRRGGVSPTAKLV